MPKESAQDRVADEWRERLAPYAADSECFLVAENVAARLGVEYADGYYHDTKGGGHAWNRLSDGTILDATHGQFDPSVPIAIIHPDDPEHRLYVSHEQMTDAEYEDFYGDPRESK